LGFLAFPSDLVPSIKSAAPPFAAIQVPDKPLLGPAMNGLREIMDFSRYATDPLFSFRLLLILDEWTFFPLDLGPVINRLCDFVFFFFHCAAF